MLGLHVMNPLGLNHVPFLYELEVFGWFMIGLVHVWLVMTWTIELILVACELSSTLYHVDFILELELNYGLVNVQVSQVMNY